MADNRISDLVERLSRGELSRRDFILRAIGAGFTASFIASALSEHAAAAPAGSGASRISAYQADEKTLIIADTMSNGQWLNMDPGWIYEINPAACLNIVYETLYHLPDSTKPDFEPLLADGQPEVSADGKTVTIKLRQGVKFHTSGNEMTSADVVFSWNRLKNIKFQPSFLATDYWDSVEAVDPYTIKINLKSANAALVPILAAGPLSPIDSVTAKANGATDAADADKTDTAKDWITSNSVGTGPYKIAKWDLNGEVIVERNPDYWGEAPKLDRIIWRNVLDTNTQLQLVQTAEIDIAYSLNLDSAQTVKDDANLQLIAGPSLGIQYLGMKVADDETADYGCTCAGPLLKKELRQAIGYGIDYDGIISGILGGAGVKIATIVPTPLLGAEEVKSLGYTLDLAKAQELFNASGVGDVEITLSYGTTDVAVGGAQVETLVQKIKADLEKIDGLTVKLNGYDGNERLADYRNGKIQSTVSPWTPDYADVHAYAEPFGRTGVAAARRIGYSNPQVDQWLDQGIAELDLAKRTEIYINIQKQLIDDAGFIVLFQSVDQKPARTNVQGVTVHSVYQIQLRYASKTA
jgi:peptide/nickel transport system substrate-binding protein